MPTKKARQPFWDLLHLGRYFTPYRIKVLWYAYLIVWAWQFFSTAYSSINSFYLMGSLDIVSGTFLAGDLLWRIVYLLLARLFIEMASVYLSKN